MEQLDKALMYAIFTIALSSSSQCLGAEHNLIWMGKPLYAKDLHCSQNALVRNFQDSSRKGAENCFQGCRPDKIIFKVFVRALASQAHTRRLVCMRARMHARTGGNSITTISNRLGVWILCVSSIWIFTGMSSETREMDNCSHQYWGEAVLQGRKGRFNRLIHWPFTFWFQLGTCQQRNIFYLTLPPRQHMCVVSLRPK